MACAVRVARSGAAGGWTVVELSRAITELRLHDRYSGGVEPDQQDIDRAELAFDLASVWNRHERIWSARGLPDASVVVSSGDTPAD